MNLVRRLKHVIPSNLNGVISRRTMRTGSLGMFDQIIISGVNFVFILAAARSLGPSAFGLFALLYSLLGVAGSVQAALITTPHTVLSGGKRGAEYRRYTGAVAILQTALAILSVVPLVIAAVVAYWFSPSLAILFLILGFVSFGSLTQGFTRRVLYTESRVGSALVNDTVTHGLRLLLLGVLVVRGDVTEHSLLLIIGVALLAGSVLGSLQIRQSTMLAFDRSVVGEHWRFGNWICAGKVFSQLPEYAAAALLSSTLSVGAYGAYRAGSQLIRGAEIPLKVLDSLLRPRLARDAHRGTREVWRTIQPILLVGGAAFALIALTLITLAKPMFELIYGPDYAPYAAVIFLLAIKPLATFLKDVLTNALLAFRLTRAIFIRTVLGTAGGTLLGGVALLLFGLPAAGAMTLMSSVISVAWLGWAWKRHLDRAEQQVDDSYRAAESIPNP